MLEQTLNLSDDFIFYTIEGEGKLAGVPSVFMRLSGCNLTCKGFASNDSPSGCDSFISWCKKHTLTFAEINNYFETHNLIEPLKQGAVLKITGGEPFLQEAKLYEWVLQFIAKYQLDHLHIDFETNGTITPKYFKPVDSSLSYTFITTITCSPKLKSNGDSEERTYKPETLSYITNTFKNDICFKFVVQSEKDIEEIFKKYIDTSIINPKDIWLMPCCGSRQEQVDNSPQVVEWCKKYKFKFSPRLQLMIWNKALGV